jgi:hypothetical protein
MQKRKIVTAVFLLAVVVIAMVGYEFFVANSLSGYTKITLTNLTYPPCSVKFGNTSYYIIFVLIGKSDDWGLPSINTPPDPFFQVTTQQTLILNLNESFRAIQGAKYSFEGLRIVVSNVKLPILVGDSNVPSYTYQLTLYVKSTISSSEPIISPIATPPTSPAPTTNQEGPIPVPTPPYTLNFDK